MLSKATTHIRDKHEADILDGAKNLSTFVKEHDVPHCRGKLCPARLKPTYSLFLNNERISLIERIFYEADTPYGLLRTFYEKLETTKKIAF